MCAALQPHKLTSHLVYEFSDPPLVQAQWEKASSALTASLSSEFTVGWLSWQLEQTLSIWTKTVAMETKFYFLLIISPTNVWAFARLGIISLKLLLLLLLSWFFSLLSHRGSFQEPPLTFYTLLFSFTFTGAFNSSRFLIYLHFFIFILQTHYYWNGANDKSESFAVWSYKSLSCNNQMK